MLPNLEKFATHAPEKSLKYQNNTKCLYILLITLRSTDSEYEYIVKVEAQNVLPHDVILYVTVTNHQVFL